MPSGYAPLRLLQRRQPNEQPPVGEAAVLLHREADDAPGLELVHVEQLAVGRELDAVGVVQIVRDRP